MILANAIACNNLISRVRLNDNFFSEACEAQLLEVLNPNKNLTEVSLQGNRLSHCCLQKINQIVKRNMKMVEDQEPDRLKAELYRLKYENQKLLKAEEAVKQQKADVQSMKTQKYNLNAEMDTMKEN